MTTGFFGVCFGTLVVVAGFSTSVVAGVGDGFGFVRFELVVLRCLSGVVVDEFEFCAMMATEHKMTIERLTNVLIMNHSF